MTDSMAERHRREIEHHIVKDRNVAIRAVDETMVPWNMKEFLVVLERYFPEEGAFRGMRVLDCGCGHGVLSILMAKRGAVLDAFDIAENRVGTARRLCEASGVEAQVTVRTGVIEEIDHPDGQFDLVLGTRILHHVDIATAGAEVYRVLKPGGMAVFWEPTLRNRLYRVGRRIYRSIPALPRTGSPDEHPLSDEEIERLRSTFGGNLNMHGAPFFLLSHIARAAGLGRIVGFAPTLGLIDRCIDRALPSLRQSNVHQILVMRKDLPLPTRGADTIA
jgi:SAM-dependent methyltransferase